jgi:hypothetical protein
MCYGYDWDCGTCPSSQPTGGSCQLWGLRCLYGQNQCACNNGQWQCQNVNGCPSNPPSSGSSCNVSQGQVCTWGSAKCTCLQNQWYCA